MATQSPINRQFRRPAPSELRQALLGFRGGLWGVVALSAMINILALGSSIYMMLVYDRVLPSQSMPTLLSLGIIFTLVFVFHGIFEVLRGLIVNGIGTSLDQKMDRRIQEAQMELAARDPAAARANSPVRDFDQVRAFVSGPGPAAFVDLPWVVLFLAVLTMLHVWLGVTGLVGVVILASLTWANEKLTQARVLAANQAGQARGTVLDRNLRHAATLRALGMGDRAIGEASAAGQTMLSAQGRLAEVSGTMSGISRVFRIFLQSLVLSVGAWLVIEGKVTGGVIFASSIIAGRAFAPVDQVIANWRGFAAARASWARLDALLAQVPPHRPPALTLPPPTRSLNVQRLAVVPPGAQTPSLLDVSFEAVAGDAIGILGPSGSGKSSLARALAQVWLPQRGAIRLDGATLDQWDRDRLGSMIGYMPQEVELFSGSIGENISRGDRQASSDMVIASARAAGVHDLILGMPAGYDTPIGYDGSALSAGQRQRVALARALFGDPFLLILDEPNSNLDPDGEQALFQAIRGVRQRGGIVALVTHQPAILRAVNKVLLMRSGQVQAFGERDEVLAKLRRPEGTGGAPAQPSNQTVATATGGEGASQTDGPARPRADIITARRPSVASAQGAPGPASGTDR